MRGRKGFSLSEARERLSYFRESNIPFPQLSGKHPKKKEVNTIGIHLLFIIYSACKGSPHLSNSRIAYRLYSNMMNEYGATSRENFFCALTVSCCGATGCFS